MFGGKIFFVKGYEKAWSQRIKVEIRFSDMLNVLVPSDQIGKASNKTLGLIERIAKGGMH